MCVCLFVSSFAIPQYENSFCFNKHSVHGKQYGKHNPYIKYVGIKDSHMHTHASLDNDSKILLLLVLLPLQLHFGYRRFTRTMLVVRFSNRKFVRFSFALTHLIAVSVATARQKISCYSLTSSPFLSCSLGSALPLPPPISISLCVFFGDLLFLRAIDAFYVDALDAFCMNAVRKSDDAGDR